MAVGGSARPNLCVERLVPRGGFGRGPVALMLLERSSFVPLAAERAALSRLVATGLGAALALPLLVYAFIGSYSRYTADDFCWAGVLRTSGFVQAQVDWYTIYSPRYAFTLLVNLVELAGPAIVPALPAAAIVVYLLVLSWTFWQFQVRRWRAVLFAEVAALATLQTAPDLPQSLYWQTGMLTYLLPLILATFLLGWIRRAPRALSALAVSSLVTFVAGGLSETYLIPQNVALTVALLAALALAVRRSSAAEHSSRQALAATSVSPARTSPRSAAGPTTGTAWIRPSAVWADWRVRHLAAALLGGVLALVAIVAAPATAARVGGSPADLWLALSASIATAAYQVLRLVRYFPFTILLCLAIPALLAPTTQRIDRRALLLVTAAAAITLPFCYFPSFYAQNGNPPARSLIVPGAILIGYLLFLGVALRQALPSVVPALQPRRAVALAALAVVPVGIAVTTLPEQSNAARYASLFDAEDQQIRASRDAGQQDLTVPTLPQNFGEDFVTADRQDWFNQCVARYYGVRSIATPAS